MSITVGFTTSSKRENSTKRLYMTETHDCTFKNGCSLLNPTLFLELETSTFPAYTAFKIENRYYNVRDIRSVRNNLFEIDGKIDVLATFKANILATTAYVIYDSITNTELPDNRLPMVTTKSVRASTVTCPFVPDGGCYILSLTGGHNTTGIYKVSPAQLASLIDDVQTIKDNFFDPNNQPPTPPTPPTTSTIESEIRFACDMIAYFAACIKWIFNAITYPIAQLFGSGDIPQNIRECKYIPFDVGTTGGAIPIYLGTFKTQQSLGKLITETVHKSVNVSIPWAGVQVDPEHFVEYSDYRRRSPYTEIYLYLPYIGMTKLSSENLVGQSSVNVAYTLALRDGSFICTVSSGSEIIGQYSGNVGASVPIGVSNINLPKAAQAVITGMGAAASQNIPAIGMGAINFADALTPNFSCIGGLDGVAGIGTNQDITCYTVFHDTIVPPNSQLQTIGSPTMAPKSLSGLTGYVQTMSASVSGSMTSEERSLINTLLDNGIYIEADEEPPHNVNN